MSEGTAEVRTKVKVGAKRYLVNASASFMLALQDSQEEDDITSRAGQVDAAASLLHQWLDEGSDKAVVAENTQAFLGRLGQPRHRQTPQMNDAMSYLNVCALTTLVESWSLDQPLPRTAAEWEEFEDADVYDELVELVMPFAYEIINGTRTRGGTAADADSPTVPLSDSSEQGQEATTL